MHAPTIRPPRCCAASTSSRSRARPGRMCRDRALRLDVAAAARRRAALEDTARGVATIELHVRAGVGVAAVDDAAAAATVGLRAVARVHDLAVDDARDRALA